MRSCSICSHPERERIDDAIISRMANSQIEKKFKVSRETVRRHAKHVLAVVKKYDETQELARGGSLKAKILLREGDLLRIQQQAEARNDLPTAIAAIRELRQFHELCAKLEGQLKPPEAAVIALNLDEQTSRRIAETYLQRHPRGKLLPQAQEQDQGDDE